ncbi:class I SAM-dependent methyltransferase [Mastigocoleus sp. MO_188.B34]|uniref:class I SAM-dependent methyltransferase n=1 Tax=Mastigocoleus sp. MO_188.B34 TaxID=3036635 RepID=UPI002623EA23|nr:class I SAM-dependent methyltransferase [Mastigocoleus sp. MO_188.B34]MDJ0693810.1 class I SAM-dependent methyltransferase [Mastigocoleus sp. MO_188.B34]
MNSNSEISSSEILNSELLAEVTNRITKTPQNRITFAEYMDLVLYHPQHGYYSQKAASLGKKGDFFTSVHLGSDFGEMLAVQFVQMWEILGKPKHFSLVELGAGQGYLALDILKYLQQHHPDFFAALEYLIVEKSPGLKQNQQQRLQEFSVQWCELESLPANKITGCFFSNELFDALPVHQFTVSEGELKEIYVTTAAPQNRNESQNQFANNQFNNLFQEITDTPSTPQIKEYFQILGVDITTYPDEYRSEVNLNALDVLSAIANKLQRGYLLTIDYGYPENRYYNPRRSQGTLQCYWQHQRHNNPYINIGKQDITAHIDFTALEIWGERYGLNKTGFTQQGLFLMALGLGKRISELSYTYKSVPKLIKRRDSLQQLLDPLGLGGFGVLIQDKGLSETEKNQPLQGFYEPQLT